MDITDRYIAYCGNDCAHCPQFKQDCAEGCLGTACAIYCVTCIVRLCNLERQSANFAQCAEYPCRKLEKQIENMANAGIADWAIAARKTLEEIRLSSPINNQKKFKYQSILKRREICFEK